MIYKLAKKVSNLRNKIIFDMGDYRQTVFLAGTGRSGTTWVEEILNSNNGFRIMFEPFHSRKIGLVREWNYKQYLRPNNKSIKFIEPATSILSGKVRDEWIDRFNKVIFPRKRLVKDIRANLFLKWLKVNFPEIPIILLLRHPCAVANSKLKLSWDSCLDDFLSQDELMKDFLNPFKGELENANDPFEKHIFLWCVENYIPLKQFNEGEILVVFYENLCMDPEREIKKIRTFVGEMLSLEMLPQVNRASALSRKDSAVNTGDNLIDAWRKHINDRQIERACEILSLFKLQNIYSKSSLPLVSGNEALRLLKA